MGGALAARTEGDDVGVRDVRVVVDAEADDEDDGDARDGVDGEAPGWQFNWIKILPKIWPKSPIVLQSAPPKTAQNKQ